MAELVLALDLPRAGDALALLDRLSPLRWVKVGSILMTREGPEFVRRLIERGLDVFLDLKWHDIPNTVAGAVSSAREPRRQHGHRPRPWRQGDARGGGRGLSR